VAKPFSVPADGPDVFWNFLLPAGVGEICYVKAIEIRPGNARSVHHANLSLDRARSSRRQENTPGEGFPEARRSASHRARRNGVAYLGTLLEGYATLPDGSRRWLIRIPRWDINWQAMYRYRQPLFLPKGAVISMRFHYDNSAENPRNPNAPPKRVVGGNQSSDEMGHLWLQVLPREGDQRAVLQEALMRHRLENDPANFSAHFNLGVLLLGRKDASSAIAHLRESLRLEPEQPLAVNDLGAALELEGRVEDALEQFRSALRLQPDYTNARFNLANGLAAQGKLEEAAANFRQALTTVPEDRAAREQLVAVLIRTGNEAATEGRLSAAAASYRELVTLRPGDADLRNNLGIILARSGDFASAAEQFEAALKANPSHQTARRNLELVRDKLAQH
jgi:Flp pilus assembly protein TadD